MLGAVGGEVLEGLEQGQVSAVSLHFFVRVVRIVLLVAGAPASSLVGRRTKNAETTTSSTPRRERERERERERKQV